MLEFSGDVNKALDTLIEAAKQVGGDAFPILVRRVVASAWMEANVAVIMAVTAWIVAWRVKVWRLGHKFTWHGDESAARIIPLLVAGVITIICLMMAAGAARDIFSPEGAVLWRLIGK